MADFTFDCPACKQRIQIDDAWVGHNIQCPICNAQVVVPPNTPAATSLGKQLVPPPSGGASKLSAGATQVARSSNTGVPIRNVHAKRGPRENLLKKIVSPILTLAILGVAVYFVWPMLPWVKAKREAEAAAAAEAEAAALAAAEAEAAKPKELPILPPVWGLDVAAAVIPEGKVNGSVGGTNFAPDAVRLERVGTSSVLTIRQGIGQSPDLGVQVYLRTNNPAGQSWTVAKDAKPAGVSQIIRLVKANPRYAALKKPFPAGYALKLEFGQTTESNTVPGKIFLSLPDDEKTVVAGLFEAVTPTYSAAPVVETPTAPASDPAADARMRSRYGIR